MLPLHCCCSGVHELAPRCVVMVASSCLRQLQMPSLNKSFVHVCSDHCLVSCCCLLTLSSSLQYSDVPLINCSVTHAVVVKTSSYASNSGLLCSTLVHLYMYLCI